MASQPDLTDLTRRERQIMDIVYSLGNATAVDVMERLPGNPVNATVRTLLGVLEKKGFLSHKAEKGKYIYSPTIPLKKARKRVLEGVLETFFKGAEASAVISILERSDSNMSEEDLRLIEQSIEEAREEGR